MLISSASTAMQSSLQQQLVEFLQDDLAISSDAIAFGLRRTDLAPNLLPMVLWQYGLVTLEQLDQIFEWMETAQASIR